MKTAVISDVHGNYPALCAVLREIDLHGCDNIISLGDVAGYYCMVNECINEFRDRKIINILGNHDSYVLGNGKCPRSYTVNQIVEIQKSIISKENMRYLRKSLPYIENSMLSARHGGWNDQLDEYVSKFNFDSISNHRSNYFCSGHTHIQMMETKGNITYFNPGSVGQPRDHDPRAAYAIIENETVNLYRIAYDIDIIRDKMRKEGYLDRVSSCLYHGCRIGEDSQ